MKLKTGYCGGEDMKCKDCGKQFSKSWNHFCDDKGWFEVKGCSVRTGSIGKKCECGLEFTSIDEGEKVCLFCRVAEDNRAIYQKMTADGLLSPRAVKIFNDSFRQPLPTPFTQSEYEAWV